MSLSCCTPTLPQIFQTGQDTMQRGYTVCVCVCVLHEQECVMSFSNKQTGLLIPKPQKNTPMQ